MALVLLSICILAIAAGRAEAGIPIAQQPTTFPSCSATPPAFADFDENGVIDRVDSNATGPAVVSLALNGTDSFVLTGSVEDRSAPRAPPSS